jgi:orotidine-5'-phosphate decarboxylase
MKKFKAFIALDATNNRKNIEVVKKLHELVYGFKVGYRSFYNKDADKLIAEIKRKKSKLFLDLKLHDIPNTVSSAIESLKNINPDFLTLHISGGEEMLKSALKNIKKFNLKTKVLGVTLLTSLDGKDSKKIYGEKDTDKLIKKLALIASNAKIAGLICSGQDLKPLKSFKKLLKITPGVKLLDRKDDQKRVSFVHDALNGGANFVVIGRELINAKNPMKLLNEYNKKYENKNLWTK